MLGWLCPTTERVPAIPHRTCLFSARFLAPLLLIALQTSVAFADFSIAGEWYMNRGRVMNWPAGGYDETCPTLTNYRIPFAFGYGAPIPSSSWIPAPCIRAQAPGHPSLPIWPVASGGFPVSPIPASGQIVTAPTNSSAVLAVGAPFRVPPDLFNRAGTGRALLTPLRVDPRWEFETTFSFRGPVASRNPSANANGQQQPAIASQTRLMQPNAWSGPGQPSRANAGFNLSWFDNGPIGLTRKVNYTPGPNRFGGTMAMFLSGQGSIFEFARSASHQQDVIELPIGDGQPRVLPVGRGYSTTQIRTGTGAKRFDLYEFGPACTDIRPPTPYGCRQFVNLENEVTPPPPLVGETIGFPWTTGHVSVLVHFETTLGVSFRSTLSAEGSDQIVGGVRTIQLVAGGVAYRDRPGPSSTPRRSAFIDVVTIRLPEPGANVGLVVALGAIAALRRLTSRFGRH